jgi:putative peptidoglycan lipid II flippase
VAALLLTHGSPPAQTAPRLVLAYAASYLVGAAVSYAQLNHRVGDLDSAATLRFAVRMALVVLVATALGWLALQGLRAVLPGDNKAAVLVRLVATGLVDAAAVLLLARALRVREVTEVVGTLTRRLRR